MTTSISAIHAAKKQFGLDDEIYRAKLTVITGKNSANAMTLFFSTPTLPELVADNSIVYDRSNKETSRS
ncbi:hypothetical protein HFO27_34875 [Rhizobium leguminosarum]|uniref:hypothetical protein n=1 Tax=Rhizobium leguminosarum TaxID=384 RepID=UPI001C916299|nr:hypothetical protein [Rhizobium leguminosarum]MBY3179689.1 hypothetical protein [Rhizobium leguminosarum]